MKAILILSLFFFCVTLSAGETEYIHQPVISTRVMGMGGAFTALADDYNGLYYNAAGLARLTKSETNIGLQVGLTPGIIGFYQSVNSAGSSSGNSNSNIQSITNTLQNNYGSHYSARVGLGGTYVKPFWGYAIQPVDLTLEADINASAGASVGVQAYQDTLIQIGHAWNLTDDKSLSFGIAPKAVYRAFIEKDILALNLVNGTSSLLSPSDAEEGMTIDTDVGFMYTLPQPKEGFFRWLNVIKPTLALAVRNAFDEGFFTNAHFYNANSSNIQAPDGNLGRRVDLGTRFDLPEFWVFKPRLMIDEHDIYSQYCAFIKCSHAGVELTFKASESITGAYRIGESEGYGTLGLSFYFGAFAMDFATYSEEIGTTDSPRESRRLMAKLSADF